jgi:t-SNARE complex subunit (syntaxin)
LSKKIGDELNMSPLYIENLFRSYTGTLGSWIMMLTDSLIREGLTDAERVKYGLDQLPVVGTFLLPAEGSNFENQFYSLKKDVDDLIKTFRQIESGIEDKGDITYLLGMTDEYKIEYMETLKDLQTDLTETADQLKEFRNIEAQIVNSTTLSSAEKKAQLDNIRAVKNELLKGYPELRKIYLEEIKERAVVR